MRLFYLVVNGSGNSTDDTSGRILGLELVGQGVRFDIPESLAVRERKVESVKE